MATTTGIRGTTDLVPRKYDIADSISLRDRNRYPLVSILTMAGKDARGQGKSIKKMVTTDPKFYWWEDTYGTERLTVTGNVDPDGGNCTITAQSSKVKVGDVLLLQAQKYVMEVSAIVDADTVTLLAERGGANGAATDCTGDALIIGNVNEEGATAPAIISTTVTNPYGYCQIFRTPIGITNTALNTDIWTKENDLDYQRKKKHSEHLRDIEKAFLFSKRSEVTSGTHPKRFTQGIINAISTNTTLSLDTEAEFLTFLSGQAFAYGNQEKYMFCSAPFLNQIEGWFKNRLTVRQDEKTYGIKILTYDSSYGTLHLVRHELLTGTIYGNWGVVVDMENLSYRYLQNRDTQLLTNRQANDEDAVVEEYLSEVGLQIEQEATHAYCSLAAS